MLRISIKVIAVKSNTMNNILTLSCNYEVYFPKKYTKRVVNAQRIVQSPRPAISMGTIRILLLKNRRSINKKTKAATIKKGNGMKFNRVEEVVTFAFPLLISVEFGLSVELLCMTTSHCLDEALYA